MNGYEKLFLISCSFLTCIALSLIKKKIIFLCSFKCFTHDFFRYFGLFITGFVLCKKQSIATHLRSRVREPRKKTEVTHIHSIHFCLCYGIGLLS